MRFLLKREWEGIPQLGESDNKEGISPFLLLRLV